MAHWTLPGACGEHAHSVSGQEEPSFLEEGHEVRDNLQRRSAGHVVLDHIRVQVSRSLDGVVWHQEHGEVALEVTAREIGLLSEPLEGRMRVRTIHEHILEDGEAKSKSIEVRTQQVGISMVRILHPGRALELEAGERQDGEAVCFELRVQLDELSQVDFVLSGLLAGLAGEWRREEGNVDGEDSLGSLVKGELERQLRPADQWPDLELADVVWRRLQRNSGTRLSLAAIGAAVGAAGV